MQVFPQKWQNKIMEKKGGQQLFYILNPPVSTKQNLLAEVFCQCFAKVPSGSTP